MPVSIDLSQAEPINPGGVSIDLSQAQPIGQEQEQPTPPPAASSSPGIVSDLVSGGLAGLKSTVYHGGDLIRRGLGMNRIINQPDVQQAMQAPDTMAGKIGKFGEQVGEFFLPGEAEEAAAAKLSPLLPKALSGLASLVPRALGTGAVNAAQGGSFGTGAAMGAGGELVGKGLQAVAPSIAESALGINRAARRYGRTPGQAILDETTGVSPGTVAEQAKDKSLALTSQLENAASSSTYPTTVNGAVQAVDDAIQTATKENSPDLAAKLGELRGRLTHNQFTNPPQAFPSFRSPQDILNLKRGIGDLVSSWNAEGNKPLQSVVKRVYGALDDELDAAVPEADALNQRISSLIPASRRAQATEEGSATMQRILGRVARPTGALVGAGIGYHEGGIPGAIAGLVAPELISSPTGQMIAARAASSPLLPRIGVAAGAQADRDYTLPYQWNNQ